MGRKGSPSRRIEPGQTVQLCDIEGPGTIRHIWLTTARQPAVRRACVIRAWWEGQEHPSIECPIGDLFGFAHGKIMPFVKRARMTFTNEGNQPVPLCCPIDYTLGDRHPEDVGRLHVLFRRENPTTEKRHFELLPSRKQKGRFIGSVIGAGNLHPGQWWGEGEVKVYMDRDTDFPAICGTGSEDYAGVAWGMAPQSPWADPPGTESRSGRGMFSWRILR